MNVDFKAEASLFTGHPYSIQSYRSHFGISIETTKDIWHYIVALCIPKHLLWALYFLKKQSL
jgi:hypothetical protein